MPDDLNMASHNIGYREQVIEWYTVIGYKLFERYTVIGYVGELIWMIYAKLGIAGVKTILPELLEWHHLLCNLCKKRKMWKFI
jgi:hypothetical protein